MAKHGCEEYDTCVLDGDCPFFVNCYLIEDTTGQEEQPPVGLQTGPS
jgi:hypothetical protein